MNRKSGGNGNLIFTLWVALFLDLKCMWNLSLSTTKTYLKQWQSSCPSSIWELLEYSGRKERERELNSTLLFHNNSGGSFLMKSDH